MQGVVARAPAVQPRGRTWQALMAPKRAKMISRSSSSVTGLSLHTKSTFSGGARSASGMSPSISSTCAPRRGARPGEDQRCSVRVRSRGGGRSA